MKHLLSILTIFAIPLTSVVVNAGEKEDRESIRALFHQEQEGHAQGNAEIVRSTYWDDFYLINTPRPGGKPHYLLSEIISGAEYFKGQGLHEDDYQGRKAWGDQLDFHSEVNHISINGDIALAVTQFNYQLTTSEGGTNNGGHLTLWVAEKRDGVWKWKNAQMVDDFSEISPPPPSPNRE